MLHRHLELLTLLLPLTLQELPMHRLLLEHQAHHPHPALLEPHPLLELLVPHQHLERLVLPLHPEPRVLLVLHELLALHGPLVLQGPLALPVPLEPLVPHLHVLQPQYPEVLNYQMGSLRRKSTLSL